MTSKPGKQTIAIKILPKISPSKGNQTMRSVQLIEYNKRNIFFSKVVQKIRKADEIQISLYVLK